MSCNEIASVAEETGPESDLLGRGFRVFHTAQSKGQGFTIWLKPSVSAGRTAWKAAVVSRGTANFATAYVAADGVLRALVPIAEPRGHLLFRRHRARRADAGAGFPVQVRRGLTPRPR